MNTKRAFALAILPVGLWVLGAAGVLQADAADPDPAHQQALSPTPATRTAAPTELEDMLSTFSPAPSFAEPTETETRQKAQKCEMQVIKLQNCEPKPGSALSAFPLVRNTERLQSATSA